MAKFRNFKVFPSVRNDIDEVVKYLKGELANILVDLQTGLSKLELVENFNSFLYTGTIAAGATAEIRNSLATIPRYRIILRSTGASIDDGVTEWTNNFVYLRNSGGSSATVTVLFLK